VRSSPRALIAASAAIVAVIVLAFALLQSGHGTTSAGSGPVLSSPVATSAPATDATPRHQLDPNTVAVQDFSYGQKDFAATRDKAQSKLWWNDGSWWAVMINPYYSEVHIFELADGNWRDTGVFVDGRAVSSADVVWTGSKLYIASRTSTGDLLLQRYTYGAGRTWTPVSATPERIAAGGGQSLTIGVDTQDRVWASWVTQNRVWISSSKPGGTGWGTPINPAGGDGAHDDDATAITAISGRIGVLWSNQSNGSFQWMSRADTAPPAQWDAAQVVVQGANLADGHINFAVSPTGDLYAAVKTSLGDSGEPLASPLIEVLHRDPAGSWSKTTAATVDNQMTRAQLMITKDGKYLLLAASSPQNGGSVYFKLATTANLRFAPGKGTLLIGWEGATINDATTTRDPIDPAVPLVVLASDSAYARYYHAELNLGAILAQQG
jgi:hypothetical protein